MNTDGSSVLFRYANQMKWDQSKIEEIITHFRQSLPHNLASVPAGIDEVLRSTLQGALNKMDVVSRQEYDVQKQVLQRTRQRLEALEDRLIQLEKDLGNVK